MKAAALNDETGDACKDCQRLHKTRLCACARSGKSASDSLHRILAARDHVSEQSESDHQLELKDHTGKRKFVDQLLIRDCNLLHLLQLLLLLQQRRFVMLSFFIGQELLMNVFTSQYLFVHCRMLEQSTRQSNRFLLM